MGHPLLSNDPAVMEDITQASGQRVKLTDQAADEVGEPDPGIRWRFDTVPRVVP